MLNTNNRGFSLIELMLAMVIGTIIIGGVLSLYISTRDTQRTSQDQMQLFSDSRFAIETIGYDLRHAGEYGRNNTPRTISCGSYDTECDPADVLPLAVTDCANNWYISLDQPIVASDDNAIVDGSDYSSTCATNGYKPNTDMLGVHYADPTNIQDGLLANGITYVRSNTVWGGLFVGSVIPDYGTYEWGSEFSWTPADPTQPTSNHKLVGHLYYVSTYTDVPGDGIPSLHRVELESGPAMNDHVLLSGVEDMQLQFGITTSTKPGLYPDSYVTADNIPVYPGTANKEWSRVRSVKIWLLMRSERKDRADIGSAQTFTIAGKNVTTANDGYRRQLVSGIIYLRNTVRLDEAAASGG